MTTPDSRPEAVGAPSRARSGPDFGPNEWMVEEKRDAWKQDPSSVSEQWRALFEAETRRDDAPAGGGGSGAGAGAEPGPTAPAAPSPEATPEGAAARTGSTVQDVTRSDLPPAPPSDVAPPTSPYAHRTGQQHTHAPGEAAEPGARTRLRGAAARTARNMEESLSVPTATSARAVPAKVLIENRAIINTHLARTRGGHVSYTHLIGWAVVEALVEMPSMNAAYGTDEDGRPAVTHPAHVGLGLAVDASASGGERRLLVPCVHRADLMDLAGFVSASEDLVRRARKGALTLEDMTGTTLTLTNPGTLGTLHSVPRLMPGQGAIIGVGSMALPAAFAGASKETLARHGIGKVLTLTSTYDHRIIQGAVSGEFLRLLETKLMGLDGFWERAFESMRVPHAPIRWEHDADYDPENETGKPARVAQLIHAFRQRGHLAADTDPLAYRSRRHPDLDPTTYGLTLWDLDRTFPTDGLGGTERATLRQILSRLREAYCRTVGLEYMHIQDPAQRHWWQERLEGVDSEISGGERRRILTKLQQAEAFETFLQTKYVGQKRFSLEGGESLIVLLDRLLDHAAHDGLDEVVIGMAHRGRLNVLTNIAGKSYGQVFDEFDGNGVIQGASTGDVKYHLGTAGVFTGTEGVSTRVSLAANPSHLETVDGVVEGIVRAKQDRIGLGEHGYTVMPVLVHGDAAFAGQGVVYETFNMSQLPAYRTGGTVHVVVNNQIGFTTGAASARSTTYATDLAKGLQVPIFHVNADDPETVARAARLAYEYRAAFHKDVIIDLICYRRRGHNEGDDPSMTQPVMYRLIDSLPSTRAVYVSALVGRGDISPEDAQALERGFHDELERIFAETRAARGEEAASRAEEEAASASLADPTAVGVERANLEVPLAQMPGAGMMIGWTSAVSREVVERVGDSQTAFPPGFDVHPKLRAMLDKRRRATREGSIDWGLGELIALGSLLMEGVPVRLVGEDARRATFAQRHAVLHDQTSGAEWTPLSFLTPDQAQLEIYDSLLSEYAALAFEYGYSVERPEGLTIWEAQFGDFANGAQSVIDEYVTSAAQKWGQRSGLVMLLPHGQEGQGPDHSSARVERYLQMCAQDNMLVAMPSTPANHFHLLREQAFRRPRRPLIVFTPKQLLRLPAATSPVEELTHGSFTPVIGESETMISTGVGVDRVLLCSGRAYYALEAERRRREEARTAIIRLERLYPLPVAELEQALEAYDGAEIVWVQDEPENQGVWPHLRLSVRDGDLGGRSLRVVSPPASASPALGSLGAYRRQQEALLEAAFAR